MPLLSHNGRFLDVAEPLLTATNSAYRYGEGLFETAKWLRGQVLFFPLHWQRLQHGLELLQINAAHITPEKIKAEIGELCFRNGCSEMARIRWSVYRQEEGNAGYVLEALPLGSEAFTWEEQGWTLGLYTANKKGMGPLANLKSANYLLYLLAAAEAKKAGMDECLVLNSEDNLCDGSRTNIFLIKEEVLHTPALHQGCVAGVMRRYLLESCAVLNIPVVEGILTEKDLLQADEVFVSNAIQGIRWVRQYGVKEYNHTFSRGLYNQTLLSVYR